MNYPAAKSSAPVWAVVPIKELRYAKQRLAAVMSPSLRRRLALAMAHDTIAVLAASGLAGIAVATSDETVIDLAGRYSARVIVTDTQIGETAAVNKALQVLAAEGHGATLFVPADVPSISVGEVGQLLALHNRFPDFIIVPAHDRFGSNAVLCAPPDVMPLKFGPDSFAQHLRAAEASGLHPRVAVLSGVGRDIDLPEDVVAFMKTPSPTRTYALLKDSGWLESQLYGAEFG